MAKKIILPNPSRNTSTETSAFATAVIDDDSLKKIISADKKVFTSTVKSNTKQVLIPIESFIKGFQKDSLQVFNEVNKNLADIFEYFKTLFQTSIEKISEILMGHSDTFDALKKAQEDALKLEQDTLRRNETQNEEENSEKPGSDKKSFFQSAGDFTKRNAPLVGNALLNPSVLTDTLIGSFLGTSIGKALGKFISSPIRGIGALLRNPYTLATVVIGNEIFNSLSDSEMIAEMAGTGSVAGAIGRFLGGSGKNDIVSKFSHYGMWAVSGATTGFMVGGPVGALAGGLAGVALGYVSEILGPDFFADMAQTGIDKVTNMLAGFSLFDINEDEVKTKIAESEATIEEQNKKYEENVLKIIRLNAEKGQALIKGDQALADKISAQIEELNSENLTLGFSIASEGEKLKELQTQKAIGMKDSFFGKLYEWFKSIQLIPFTDITIGNIFIPDLIYENIVAPTIETLGNIGDMAMGIINSIGSTFVTIKDKVVSDFVFVKDKVVNAVTEFTDGIFDSIKSFFNSITKWFDDNFSWNKFQQWWYGEDWEETPDGKWRNLGGQKADKRMEVDVDKYKRQQDNDAFFNRPRTEILDPADVSTANVVLDVLKKRDAEITKRAKEAQGDGGFQTMMENMTKIMNNQVVNNNVSQRTTISRPLSTRDEFPNYMRWER